MHTHTRTHTHMRMRTHTHMRMRTHTHMRMRTHTHARSPCNPSPLHCQADGWRAPAIIKQATRSFGRLPHHLGAHNLLGFCPVPYSSEVTS